MAIPTTPPPGGALLCAGPLPLPAAGADPAALLDLHEGIRTLRADRHEDPQLAGCRRWPEHLRLLNATTGELVPGRCRSTNLCRYCARLFAVETSEMLLLDAMEDAPELYLVLTSREHLTRAQATEHLRKLRRATRLSWPTIRWAVTVEFQRRGALHLNLLVKGVPVTELAELHELVVDLWCSRVDALPKAQWSGVIADELGVVKYVSLHFMKASQAPAIGWRGHRYSSSRDYLVRSASVMRLEARQSLRLKRLLHRGLDVETAELELAAANATTWSLEHVRPSTVERDPPPRAPELERDRDDLDTELAVLELRPRDRIRELLALELELRGAPPTSAVTHRAEPRARADVTTGSTRP